ncbi:MAG: CRISPR-associated endonuclease Cas2 [Patescibacteria group bacterium]
MRSSVTNSSNKKKEKIFHKLDSATSKLLEVIVFLVGLHYVAFSRKSLMAKLSLDPYWEGQRLFNTLSNLERGNFIKKSSNSSYKLTQKGIRRINFSKLFKLSLDKKKKDGLWRVVIFDIPEKQRIKRDLLRQKLREFDFKMVQKSVFVSSYVCEKEIKELCKILDFKKEVSIFLTKTIN